MKIIQIIPAGEWFALFTNNFFTDVVSSPLVCWALVENEGRRYITGMILEDGIGPNVWPAGTSAEGFIGYFTEMPDDETIEIELKILKELHEERSL